jgi:hypothetical protein
MERNGVSEEAQAALRSLQDSFREDSHQETPWPASKPSCPPARVVHLVEFVQNSQRGICK